MRKGIGIFLVLLLATQTLVAQQPLGITRVLLYKNGMAYIVRSGQITAPVSLTFHPEDMNDVLKSFTAWNPDNGSLYSVGYTAGIPSSHMLSRFPFDISAPDTGLGGFLVQVKGADVKLDHSWKGSAGKARRCSADGSCDRAANVFFGLPADRSSSGWFAADSLAERCAFGGVRGSATARPASILSRSTRVRTAGRHA